MLTLRSTWPVAVTVGVLLVSGCGDARPVAHWYVVPGQTPSATTAPIRIEHRPDCEKVGDIAVIEHPDRVEITVHLTLTHQEPSCPDVAGITDVDVSLDEPLADRELAGPGYQLSS